MTGFHVRTATFSDAVSETRGVAHDVARRRARAALPAGAVLVAAGGVEAAPVDDHVHVPGGGVDGHPAPAARSAPGHELARGVGPADEPGAVQRVGDRARAVVARVVPLPVAAAVLVRLRGDAAPAAMISSTRVGSPEPLRRIRARLSTTRAPA